MNFSFAWGGVLLSALSSNPPILTKNKAIQQKRHCLSNVFLVGEGGFEPPKREATDLQSAPFGHSGILPY